MTLASSIITDAYRETNIVPMAGSPNTNQITEALTRLNRLIESTVGLEAGDDLEELDIGGNYDESIFATSWVPDNVRLMLNLAVATTFQLDPNPKNGQRIGIVDVGSNLATYNLTLDGNGRNIEGAATLVLSTDDLTRHWMYRSDTGNWVRIAELASSDQLPFASEFDDYFVIMLAMRLNPRYGQSLKPETLRMLSRMRNSLQARYHQSREIEPDGTPLTSDNNKNNPVSSFDFNTGRRRPWLR